MSERKNYNSIIFLTTLSVYLGLVLVGAPAPVLAQAALTSKIEVKDKIEKKDDLDNKPDEDSESLQEIYAEKIFADFVKDLQNLQARKRYSSIEEKDFNVSRILLVNDSESDAENIPNIGVSSLNKVLVKLLESLDDNQLRGLADFSWDTKFGVYPSAFDLKIYTNVSGVKLETYFKKATEQKASLLAERLNDEFISRVNKAEDNFAKQIYENTKVTSFNNQVFITTQLPRGSLDALLTQSAK